MQNKAMFFRYKIIVEYDGTGLSGWQKQKHSSSVQECIENAINSFTRENVTVYGAGRTDAGVHALGQVAHFDLTKCLEEKATRNAINHFLKPHKISIVDVKHVENSFHARFDAKQKVYTYKILNREAPSPILKNKAWHVKEYLDIDKIQSAANLLIGKYDFSSFRGTSCQAKSPIRTIDYISVCREQDIISISIAGRSFLYNQVRIITGCLRKVGSGKINNEDIKTILLSKNRSNAAETAPEYGLYLSKIFYDA